MSPDGRISRRRRVAGVIAALRHRDEVADEQREPAPETELAALRRRVDHLEAALEGLQDSVYRESRRHDDEIQALQKLVTPHAMSQAIEADARRRGL
jgi:hypothetical protein